MMYEGYVFRSTNDGTTWTQTISRSYCKTRMTPTATTVRKWPSTPIIRMWSMSVRRKMVCLLDEWRSQLAKRERGPGQSDG